MLSGCLAVVAAAQETKGVTIFIDGINSRDIIDASTGDTLFPPSADTIVPAVAKAVPSALKAIITKDWSVAEKPVCEAVAGIFLPIACDEHGKPSSSTAFDWEWLEPDELLEEIDDTGRAFYCFDWRLDMKTIATDLHSFIEYVLETTGESKVNLVGFSMGTCALMSYLKLYDYQYVNSVVLLAGGYNGVGVCGQPFAGKVKLSSESLLRYLDSVLGTDMTSIVVSALIDTLNSVGLLDSTLSLADEAITALNPAFYDEVFSTTFATIPGMWALVPAELYEMALANAGDSISPETMEMISWYHDEVQACNEEIIQGCLDRGIKFGIIAKYGYPIIPVCEEDSNTDMMIDTKYESFGATVATCGEGTLGEGYTQAVSVGFDCVSPDNIIDASTCVFPEYTWFVKNSVHGQNMAELEDTLIDYIIHSDEQVSVTDGVYSQFNIIVDGNLEPLTAENDYSKFSSDTEKDSLFNIFANFNKAFYKQVLSNLKNRFMALKSMLKAVC